MIKQQPSPTLPLLRRGTATDVDSIVRIMDSAFDPLFGEAWTRSQCAGILPMSGVVLTLAVGEDKEPFGFSLQRTIAGEAELLLIAVAREDQGRGIGRGLLDRFIADAQAAGATKVHLEVRENNPAIGMYRSAGFQQVGRRSEYYYGKDGSCFDALTFVQLLDNAG
ncbi:MAG: GNAT family N-acetyltransferase [Sphingomicrobium sp.]